LVISNVPGPPMPLYMAGAKLKSYYPVSIVTHGLALNITIHSYAGSLDYGFIAAKEQVPKLAHLIKCLSAAHKELVAVAIRDATALGVMETAVVKKPVVKKPLKRAIKQKVATVTPKRKVRSKNV
jgi:diacylglycerol O-acyltransferase / wax synthase